MRLNLILPSLLCFCLGASHAQSDAAVNRGPDGRMTYHVPGIEVLAIPGRPFTASDSIDWVQTLEDGNVVKKHLEAAVARDSEGRLYRERRRFGAANSGQPSPLIESIVSDPVAGTRTTCTVAQHRCVVAAYRPVTKMYPMPVGPFANGTRTLARESLGNDTMSDLPVLGTRETVTIAPGTEGNDRPLTSTREFWYSADLETNLAVTRKDPREGTQTIRFMNLSRSEPAAGTFQVPAGYTVVDQRPVAQAATK